MGLLRDEAADPGGYFEDGAARGDDDGAHDPGEAGGNVGKLRGMLVVLPTLRGVGLSRRVVMSARIRSMRSDL